MIARRTFATVISTALPVLLAAACLSLGGCIAIDASRDADSAPEPSVGVELLMVAMDGDRFAGTTNARWLQSFLEGEARDVDIAISRSDDLLADAKKRLRSAPGFEFLRTHMVVVRSGSPAAMSETMGTGSELTLKVRPRRVRDGVYEVSPSVDFLHKQASGDGVINGVSYRAPALRYGTVPLTVSAGETRGVRMRREIGTATRPENLQIFVFAKVTPMD